jgi:hypothetical protein
MDIKNKYPGIEAEFEWKKGTATTDSTCTAKPASMPTDVKVMLLALCLIVIGGGLFYFLILPKIKQSKKDVDGDLYYSSARPMGR